MKPSCIYAGSLMFSEENNRRSVGGVHFTPAHRVSPLGFGANKHLFLSSICTLKNTPETPGIILMK